MLRRILAPTDGSPESEKALPLAEQIARAHDAELVLVCLSGRGDKDLAEVLART